MSDINVLHNIGSIVVPVTSRGNKTKIYPSQVELGAHEGGLPADSVVLCEQVRAVEKSRLTKLLGHLPAQKLSLINTALKIALDLP